MTACTNRQLCPRSVRLTHSRTGIVVELCACQTGISSWAELQERALRIMRARLFARQRGVSLTCDRVRTYHNSSYGAWIKDHRTGERFEGLFLEIPTRKD